MKYLFVLCAVLCGAGCVQVPDQNPVPRPVPPPSVPDAEFSQADPALVSRLLASQELRDPVRLRRYAALYRGMEEATKEPGVSVMQVMSGGMKTTEQFVQPRSKDMQAILVDYMPKPPLSEQDRGRISDAFRAMSLACHAAAHRLETGGA